MVTVKQLTMEELEVGLQNIGESPKSEGLVELIVRRPETLGREILEVGELDVAEGLVGDNWKARGSKSTSSRCYFTGSQRCPGDTRISRSHPGARR